TAVNNITYQKVPLGAQISTDAFEIITGAVAYDAPLGPTIIDIAASLGLVSPSQKVFYETLAVAPDTDDSVNDKDDFVKALINANLAPLGYDPIGLAGSPINATLLQGDYLAVHAYGWTEFTIDPISQQLDITTWGVPAYTRAQMQANAQSIIAIKPVVISRFTVTPR
ncbi:MAG: alkaline phosphatase D family protein, partial [Thermoanaerobaculia bacterium]